MTTNSRLRAGVACTLIVMAMQALSCSTGRRDARYVVDGIQYGVTEGTFRGRWWNHYERGLSFLRGEFYAEAEADFQKALAGRRDDQRWARTYGLHLLPSYFPNRDLAIAALRQGRAGEAMERLETSLGMAWSAQAAYYLDIARAHHIAETGVDSAPPAIEILGEQQATVSDLTFRIQGRVTDDTYVGTIRLNGRDLLIRQSSNSIDFDEVITLAPGTNQIVVEARDLLKQVARKTIQLEADHDGPIVSFDTFDRSSSRVSGAVHDAAGVTSVTIGGSAVRLSRLDADWSSFTAMVSPDDVLSYTAVDALGNLTEGTITAASLARTAAQAWDLNLNRTAPDRGGDIVLAAAKSFEEPITFAAEDEYPTVRIVNLPEESRFVGVDEIQVQVSVNAVRPLKTVSLSTNESDSVPISIPGNRTSLRFSRRLPIGSNVNLLIAHANDDSGNRGEATTRIRWEPVPTEAPNTLARAALIARPATMRTVRNSDLLDLLTLRMERHLGQEGHRRFELIARDIIEDVLFEQEIASILASPEGAIQLGQLSNAEVLVVYRLIEIEQGNIEASVEIVNAETSAKMAFADVAGPVQDLERLFEELAALIVQAFPRSQGVVQMTSIKEGIATLSQQDNVRKGMRCILFREGDPILHPIDGSIMSRDIEVLGDARLTTIQNAFSRLVRIPATDGALEPLNADENAGVIHVVTK